MSMQTTVTRRVQHYSLSTTMDPAAADKEERKREVSPPRVLTALWGGAN
jgi:hypothetical protein